MTPRESVLLTRYVKACCPQQAIDEYTPDAWHDLLGDLDLEDCRAAVVAVAKAKPFVAPAEIRAEVKRIRRDRLDRAIAAAPDPDLADQPRRYQAALHASIRRIADGQTRWLAIDAPVREDGPPEGFAMARAALGPVTPRLRAVPTLQEIARHQAAESRAQRASTEAS